MIRGLMRFARRVWIYRSILWRDRDYDYAFLLELMEIKLRLMAEHFERHAIMSRSDRMARECRIAAHLCRRIVADDYSVHQVRLKVPQQDAKMLGRLIGRKIGTWWD